MCSYLLVFETNIPLSCIQNSSTNSKVPEYQLICIYGYLLMHYHMCFNSVHVKLFLYRIYSTYSLHELFTDVGQKSKAKTE